MLEENKERIQTVLRNDLNKIDFEVEIELISVITEAAEGNIDLIWPWMNPYLLNTISFGIYVFPCSQPIQYQYLCEKLSMAFRWNT